MRETMLLLAVFGLTGTLWGADQVISRWKGDIAKSTLSHMMEANALQNHSASDALAAYKALHEFILDGGQVKVSNVTLKRDRAEMTFTGTFYFPKPVLGKVTGAVFIGEGMFRAEPPPSAFEKENLRRMLRYRCIQNPYLKLPIPM